MVFCNRFPSGINSNNANPAARQSANLIHARGRLITFDIAEDVSYTGDESLLRQLVSIAKSIVELHRGKIQAGTLDHNRVMFEVILRQHT